MLQYKIDANAHALHADLLFYLRQPEATLRPSVVAGAGAKFYYGVEAMNVRPLADNFGGGVCQNSHCAGSGL